MIKDLLFYSPGIQLYRSSWGAGRGGLPGAWQSDERSRVSFPETPLRFGPRERADIVGPGGAIALGAEHEHGVRRARPSAGRSVWIGMAPDVFGEVCGAGFCRQMARRAGRVSLGSDARAALAVQTLARCADSGTLDAIGAEALMYELVERVCGERWASRGPARDHAPANQLDAVMHAVSLLQDCDGELSLTEIGREVRMSPHHFCRVFKRSTGMTVQGFRRRARLLRAADRVLEGRAPLAVVAHECGFSDQAHMTRAFTSSFGVPPARLARAAPRIHQMRRILQDTVAGGS